MPPRRSARLAAAPFDTRDLFATLPHALVVALFALLPVDTRLRCAEVCRAWRATLTDTSLWLRLNLSAQSGVARITGALLHAAAARAAGQLATLDVTGSDAVTFGTVRAIAAANAGTLRELLLLGPGEGSNRYFGHLSCQQAEQLLLAAPLLRVLETRVHGPAHEVRRMLRCEAPFAPLRITALYVYDGLEDADTVRDFAADLAADACVTAVHLSNAALHVPAALDAVVGAAVARRMRTVELYSCGLSPASMPALARLLGGNAVAELCIHSRLNGPLLDEPAAALLGDALQANTSLTTLRLQCMDLWRSPATTAVLFGALTGHPRLRTLAVSDNHIMQPVGDAADAAGAAGAALGTLLLANAPALQQLDVSGSRLGDVGLGLLVDALPHNTHLRTLDCGLNGMSEAFARDRLLPAVRANASLRTLTVEPPEYGERATESAREAAAFVAARAQQSGA
jgi:hypothetical protein